MGNGTDSRASCIEDNVDCAASTAKRSPAPVQRHRDRHTPQAYGFLDEGRFDVFAYRGKRQERLT